MKVSWNRRSSNARMGRFGGGWQVAFGFRASRRTLMLELLVGTLRFDRQRKSVPLGTCPHCGWLATSLWAEVRHMERHHPEVVEERLRRAGLR